MTSFNAIRSTRGDVPLAIGVGINSGVAVAGNMGFVLPKEGFLAGLRRLCDEHGALLVFDEVMTGFRVAYGGAQAMFGIAPGTLPRDWESFAAERDRWLASDELTVTGPARQIAERLVIHPPLPLGRAAFRDVTALLLPERLRLGYGLPFGPTERRNAERALAWLRTVYPNLPAALRLVGPYREAIGRLEGRARPAPLTRALNRFWIGAPALPEADQALRVGSEEMRRGSSSPAVTNSNDTEFRQ